MRNPITALFLGFVLIAPVFAGTAADDIQVMDPWARDGGAAYPHQRQWRDAHAPGEGYAHSSRRHHRTQTRRPAPDADDAESPVPAAGCSSRKRGMKGPIPAWVVISQGGADLFRLHLLPGCLSHLPGRPVGSLEKVVAAGDGAHPADLHQRRSGKGHAREDGGIRPLLPSQDDRCHRQPGRGAGNRGSLRCLFPQGGSGELGPRLCRRSRGGREGEAGGHDPAQRFTAGNSRASAGSNSSAPTMR